MTELVFRPFEPGADDAAVVDLLTTETWTYRLEPTLSTARAHELLSELSGEAVLTFLIEVGGEVVGFVRAEDLDEELGDPQLDVRIRQASRGQGIGTQAIRYITDEVFTRFPDKRRIEGQTREDNAAMRRAFVNAGYVKEAVYRQAWPDRDGTLLDGVGYAILRCDWAAGTTTPVRWEEP